jgi:hypothetical protein
MPTNDLDQEPVQMPSAATARWGQVVKTLASNIDHLRPPTNIVPNQPLTMVGGPPPGEAQPTLADWAQRMAGTAPGTPLDLTRAEFEALVRECNVGLALPAGISTVRLIQSGGNVLVVRLPARRPLLKVENGLLTDTPYRSASFITDWYVGRVTGGASTPEDQMDLHDAFVGDYAITHCM